MYKTIAKGRGRGAGLVLLPKQAILFRLLTFTNLISFARMTVI